MHLNHLDLPVPDVAATRRFFEAHFGFRHLETKGRDGLSILQDDAGLVLVISRAGEGEGFPRQFHIGFLQRDEAAVRSLHERFSMAGLDVSPVSAMRGGVMFYGHAPGGILFEVSWRP